MRGLVVAVVPLLALGAGCEPRAGLDREALLDPATCQPCHPNQYREWSGSMHAYASDDPVFLAQNAHGQADTNGALGGFCVRCHAPVAAMLGATVDGLNLATLPRRLRGVTCWYCHSIDAVEADHNAAFRLADDGVMRGGLQAPVDTPAHGSVHSPLHEGGLAGSSALCGSCHDVVTPAGVALERTFAEWRASIFGQDTPGAVSCGGCHMPGRDEPAAAVDGAPVRRVHDHAMPGVDVALSEWPETAAQRAAIDRDLAAAISAQLCVSPDLAGVDIAVTLDNVLVGHAFPSGVTHARRAWVEVVAYAGEQIVYQSGLVPDGTPVLAEDDPDLWLLSGRLFGGTGGPVRDSWWAATIEETLLPPAVTLNPDDPRFYHAVTRVYEAPAALPDRITLAVRLQPVGLEILDELIVRGELDPAVRARLPTLTLAETQLTWRAGDGFGCVR